MAHVQLTSGEILGTSIQIYQEDFDLPEFAESITTGNFENFQDALAAGCEFGVVNWSAYCYFEGNGEPIQIDEAYDWSGY